MSDLPTEKQFKQDAADTAYFLVLTVLGLTSVGTVLYSVSILLQ